MIDWFTADWHLGHTNIIRFCDRPFKNTHEMDTTIIGNTNAVCMPDDKLIHLGDVAWRGTKLADVKAKIACRNIFIVPGNHDHEDELKRYFHVLPQCYMYKNIVLCHYAMRVWARSHHRVGHLYGHSHGTLPPLPDTMAFDIGVDCWDFRPLSLAQVEAEFKRLVSGGKNAVIDHHGREHEAIRNNRR